MVLLHLRLKPTNRAAGSRLLHVLSGDTEGELSGKRLVPDKVESSWNGIVDRHGKPHLLFHMLEQTLTNTINPRGAGGGLRSQRGTINTYTPLWLQCNTDKHRRAPQ